MLYTVEYGLRKYIEVLRSNYSGTIADMLKFEVVSCDEENDNYVLKCRTEPWMCNHYGTLHGGLCATILDQAMGMVCSCIKKGYGTCTTVQLESDYHRPIPAGDDILVHVHVMSITRVLMNLTAEIVHPDKPNKFAVTGSGIFFFRDDDRKPLIPFKEPEE
jgi:uncharacterized protein (TIGR00369 family)